jgi:hypothetical protein
MSWLNSICEKKIVIEPCCGKWFTCSIDFDSHSPWHCFILYRAHKNNFFISTLVSVVLFSGSDCRINYKSARKNSNRFGTINNVLWKLFIFDTMFAYLWKDMLEVKAQTKNTCSGAKKCSFRCIFVMSTCST